jgi:hypothetical protein
VGRWNVVILVAGVAIATAVAVAVVGLALGGGGGTSREDYQTSVVNARDRIDFALERITRAETVDDLTGRIDEAAEVVDDTAGDLDGAGVADGFDDENNRLVRALHAFSSELAGTAATLRDPAFTDTLPLIRNLSFKQWEVVNRLLGDLKRQGIEVEPLARH